MNRYTSCGENEEIVWRKFCKVREKSDNEGWHLIIE